MYFIVLSFYHRVFWRHKKNPSVFLRRVNDIFCRILQHHYLAWVVRKWWWKYVLYVFIIHCDKSKIILSTMQNKFCSGKKIAHFEVREGYLKQILNRIFFTARWIYDTVSIWFTLILAVIRLCKRLLNKSSRAFFHQTCFPE